MDSCYNKGCTDWRLETSEEKIDLGVLVDNKMTMNNQNKSEKVCEKVQ